MWCTVVATGMCTTNLLADVHLDVPTESAIDWLDVVRLVLQRLVVVAADRAAPASPAAASPAAAAAPAVPAAPPSEDVGVEEYVAPSSPVDWGAVAVLLDWA